MSVYICYFVDLFVLTVQVLSLMFLILRDSQRLCFVKTKPFFVLYLYPIHVLCVSLRRMVFTLHLAVVAVSLFTALGSCC